MRCKPMCHPGQGSEATASRDPGPHHDRRVVLPGMPSLRHALSGMTRLSIGGVFAVLLAAMFVATPVGAADDIEILTTPSGIEFWLKSEPSIPIVAMEMAFRGGATLDPEGKDGLTNMLTGLLDEGAGDLESQAFQDRLDELSVRMSFDAGRDAFYGSLTALTANLDEAADLFRLALTAPRFDDEPVERIRGQILVGLLQEEEDPHSRAWQTWSRTAFPDHPYGRPVDGTADTVGAIAAADLAGYVADNFTRDRLVLAIVGDIGADEAIDLVDTIFGTLPANGAPLETPTVEPVTGLVEVVDMDVPQSAIVFGLPGLLRDDPDFYAAYVLNKALGGGGLNTRLFEEVRKERGLAYSVSTFVYSYDHAGLWLGSSGTQNARAGETLDVIRQVLEDVAENGITAQELDDARDYLTGSFPLRLDSNGAIANMLLSVQLQDLGEDYLENRNGYIEAVTADDVQRVARRLLDTEDLLVVVAGQPVGITPSDPVD